MEKYKPCQKHHIYSISVYAPSRGQQLCLGVLGVSNRVLIAAIPSVVSRGFRQAAKGPLRSAKADSWLILSTLHSTSVRLNLSLLLCLYVCVSERGLGLWLMLDKFDGICHQ